MTDPHPVQQPFDTPEPAMPARADAPAIGADPLGFPDLPRLELDQLLVQLVDRAQEVMAAQNRLRGLLRANQLISGHLALPELLRGIVEAARELVGARYAALGVIAPDGGLAEFVHSGMPADDVERIGHLPQGKGLLGALIEDPQPIRLLRIGDDPRSSGFPASHPPMDSFLGVPIRVRSEVFGNLYFAESTKQAFSAEDEDLARALAATAAVAIANARLYEASRARGEWLQASAAVTSELLANHLDAAEPLRAIAEHSRRIAHADVVTVARPVDPATDPAGEDAGLRVEVAVGPLATEVLGDTVSLRQSLAGYVYTSGDPVRISQPGDRGLRPATVGDLEVGPVMALPMRGSSRVHGVLTLARARGRQAFGADELEMAGGFADQAAVAIELAAARAEQERAQMLDERERIAADMHDLVIQRLFAAGLTLQGSIAGIPPGRSRDRVTATIEDLDTTIRQIRTSIFQLQRPTTGVQAGLRARLLDIATEAAAGLGFDPAVRFSGVIDVLPEHTAGDLEAALREALSNVARHAGARTVEVDVVSRDGGLVLTVRDDGAGIGDVARRSGLANLDQRARRHGGTCTVEPAEPTGTHLTWRVPTT
jgi:signal transduction histidine kinase